MENDFEALISSFIQNKIGITENFLSINLSNHLKSNLLELYDKKLLSNAGTGNSDKIVHDDKIRGDSIYWLDRKHENIYENDFFDIVDDFIKYLNKSCYAGITGYEFHYSLYEIGSFYQKHLDQFQNNSSRKYSLISYLNDDWKEKDGGELLVYQTTDNQKISPTNGKTVFFQSNELLHEVLITNQRRMSICGWLKRN